jgi:hypothetical protein
MVVEVYHGDKDNLVVLHTHTHMSDPCLIRSKDIDVGSYFFVLLVYLLEDISGHSRGCDDDSVHDSWRWAYSSFVNKPGC